MSKPKRYCVLHFSMGAVAAAALFVVGIQGAIAAGATHDMSNMAGMQPSHPAERFSFGEPGKAAKGDRTIKVTMNAMSFEPKAIQVTTGETIRFVVTNKSPLDHDFTIGDVKTQTAHRAEMAEAMKMGAGMGHGDDPNAMSVKAGETRELIWKFSRAGNFQFDCNVPGHFEAGMMGTIAVHEGKPGKGAGAAASPMAASGR